MPWFAFLIWVFFASFPVQSYRPASLTMIVMQASAIFMAVSVPVARPCCQRISYNAPSSFNGYSYTSIFEMCALDLDAVSEISTCNSLYSAYSKMTYGGRRASLQLLERKATPACENNVVSLMFFARSLHRKPHLIFPASFLKPHSVPIQAPLIYSILPSSPVYRKGALLTAKKETATTTLLFSGLESSLMALRT